MDGVERLPLPLAVPALPRIGPDPRSQERRRKFEQALAKRAKPSPAPSDRPASAPASHDTPAPSRPGKAADGTGQHVDLLA
jgi:hypothetical protein